MKKLLGTMLVLSTIAWTQPQAIAAEIHLDGEIEKLPAIVTEIYNCGLWAREDEKGFFRVIFVEYFNGCSLLYLQWIKDYPSNDPTRHVMHTLSIKEFNANDHIELTFGRPVCKETPDGIQFDIVAKSGQDGKQHRFNLEVHRQFGEYSIRELKEE